MPDLRAPILPMPSEDEITGLTGFLAANIAVSTEDGDYMKAAIYQALHNTAKALAERAVDLSKVTRVVVVRNPSPDAPLEARAFDKGDLFDNGCVIDVQDDGRTVKLLPTPARGAYL